MEKQVRLTAIVREAVQFIVTVPDLNDYMNALTVIFNNVRDSRELYRVTNNYKNDIYVDCEPESADRVKEWLEQFGEVSDSRKTLAYTVEIPDDWDLDKYWEAFVVSEE